MFIQTEETPNPDALKFIIGADISESPIHFSSKHDAKGAILVLDLFKIEGVKAVFFGSDFITITKDIDEKWEALKPHVIAAIMDHLTSGKHAMEGYQPFSEERTQNYSDIEKQIIEIIETRVRPSVAMDGGDIVYKDFKDGIVYLELKGSCSGCPSSEVTLKNGIESMLQYYIPEVVSVEQV